MQERQDLINHSPTGISWGYGGSSPAQAAFAVLMDYLGDEERARALYRDFKFRVVAKFPPNSEWTLTGRQIENAITRIGHRLRLTNGSWLPGEISDCSTKLLVVLH